MDKQAPDAPSITTLLSRALHRIRSTPPRVIASPATQPRRAAVALIIRVTPPPAFFFPPSASPPSVPTPGLSEFFQLDWVTAPGARPEILFLQRDKPDASADGTRDSHVAFPGGKMEEGDEGGLYTAMRQTWEEIGLDLAEQAYTCIGQLDDREITTSLGKRLLMILSPFVFLQLVPHTTSVEPATGTALHWIPLAALVRPRWTTVKVDASARLAARSPRAFRLLVRALVGDMRFPAVLVDVTDGAVVVSEKRARKRGVGEVESQARGREEMKLWGLSLGMTLDLLTHMVPARESAIIPPDADGDLMGVPVLAPSLTSVFPRFSYPDVNFWIWVFGKRYREVVRGWEASVRTSGTNDRRMNWTGSALNTFYAAVRKALVVVIVMRAIIIFLALVFGGWFMFWR